MTKFYQIVIYFKKELSPILLQFWIFIIVTLQLGQLKHSDFYLRGRQQLFMGVLFVHWTTVWVRVELSRMVPLEEDCRAQGNTPDFMFEHFIVHLSDDTSWTPPVGGWSSTVMAIQLCTLKADPIGKQLKPNPILKPCNKITMIRHMQHCQVL